MSKTLSVIIPVYNCEKYLRQCLDSVLGQSLRDVEILCVDDGSTDASPTILAEYASRDERIVVITQPNGGAGAARNTGLSRATGEYLLFLDGDDWFERDYFEAAVNRISADHADICICGYEAFDAKTGETLPSNWDKKKGLLPPDAFSPEEVSGKIFQLTDGQVWDKLYRRSFVERSGIRFPAIRAAEDTAFMYRTLLSAERVTSLQRVFVHYRINRAGSVSKSFTAYQSAPFDSFELIYDFLRERGLMPKYERSFKNWAMEYLVWQVNNMPDSGIRKQYLTLLKEKWFPELRFERGENAGIYRKYLLAKFVPTSLYGSLVSFIKALR